MYTVWISKSASKYLARMEPLYRERIYSKMLLLSQGIRDWLDIKQMQGYDDLWRLRVGDFRVIYTIRDDILHIEVIQIGSRWDIYKKF